MVKISRQWGLWFGLAAATLFGTSAILGKTLLAAGWTPGALIATRVLGVGLILLPGALVALRGHWNVLWRNKNMLLGYGVVSIAGTQLFYFNALQTLPVSAAMILEYASPFFIMVWLWLRHGRTPARVTLVAFPLSLGGLLLMINLAGATQLNPIGLMWGLASAACSATFFLMCAQAAPELPSSALISFGMLVAGAVLLLTGVVGVLPLRFGSAAPVMFGSIVNVWVLIAALVVVSAVVPYLLTTMASRLLGAQATSFLAMFEVVAATAFAAVVLREVPTWQQILGGLMIMGSAVLVNRVSPQPATDIVVETVELGEVKPTVRVAEPELMSSVHGVLTPAR